MSLLLLYSVDFVLTVTICGSDWTFPLPTRTTKKYLVAKNQLIHSCYTATLFKFSISNDHDPLKLYFWQKIIFSI